jgi:hypothetical protein
MRKYSFLKQYLIVFFLTGCTSLSVRAQYSLGLTANYAIATDDLAKGAKNGYGATLQGRYHFDEILSMGIDVGYITFENKKTDSKISPLIDGDRLNIIPVTASFQVNLRSKKKSESDPDAKLSPLIGLDLGWATANMNLESGSKSYFAIAPQVGLDYALNDQMVLRFSAKDNVFIYKRLVGGTDILSYVGINLGGYYKF